MTSRGNLRSVAQGDKPTTAKNKQTVSQAAASGNHRSLLVAMRERIAKTVSDPDCPPRDLAALTRRLQDIAKEIEAIDAQARDEGEARGPADESFDASAI